MARAELKKKQKVLIREGLGLPSRIYVLKAQTLLITNNKNEKRGEK